MSPLGIRSSVSRRAFWSLLTAVASAALIVGAASAAKRKRVKHPPAAKPVKPGALDPSFGRGGIATLGTHTRLFGIAAQRDGKLVAVGESGAGSGADLLVVRFTTTGALDKLFGHGGMVHGPALSAGHDRSSVARAVAIEPNGKLVVVGSASDRSGNFSDGLVVERYTPSGGLDRSFGSGGVREVLTGSSFGAGDAVAIQRGGQIIATGSADAAGSGGTTPRVAVVRLTAGGTPDSSFSGGGVDLLDLGAFSYALGVALAPNGKIVIAGSQAPQLQVTNALIARLTPSGALDRSFASGKGYYAHQYAKGAAFSSFNGVAVQRSGSIVAVGSATQGQAAANALAARFSASGGPAGVTYTPSATNFTESSTSAATPGASAVAISSSGQVFATGELANRLSAKLAVWAFNPGGGLNGRFGSRGVALTRPSSGANAEGAAIALVPGGKVVVAGDQNPPATTRYTGIVARFGG